MASQQDLPAIVPHEDDEARNPAIRLPLYTAPLDGIDETAGRRRRHLWDYYTKRKGRHHGSQDSGDSERTAGEAPLKLAAYDSGLTSETRASNGSDGVGLSRKVHDESPRRRQGTKQIELFYDLFMVANLTLFSKSHGITNSKTLASYVAFFSIIWFTWLNLALFTVRFGGDSVLERLYMGLQLGGMVGFAVVSPRFFPNRTFPPYHILTATSLILMATRIVTAAQYFTVALYIRQHKARVPILAIAGTTLTAAIIYGLLTIAFTTTHDYYAYCAWFIVAAFEAVANVLISSEWKLVSFKKTYLVERMSLLTLIILGEGVIVLFESLELISKNGYGYTSATVGNVFSCVVIYYFLYMLYFDKFVKGYFGLVREQIWAFMHFAFHVALILVVSGVNQYLLLQKVAEQSSIYLLWFYDYADAGYPSSLEAIRELGQNATSAVNDLLTNFKEDPFTVDQENNLTAMANNLANYQGPVDRYQVGRDITNIISYIEYYLFGLYDLNGSQDNPDYMGPETTEGTKLLAVASSKTKTVFFYVYTCAGLCLVFIAILSYIMRSHHVRPSKRTWISIVAHLVSGTALMLLDLTWLQSDTDPHMFAFSAWSLPTIAIIYFCNVLVDLVTAAVPSREARASAKAERMPKSNSSRFKLFR